jgi:flagellar hook assembly protein FlgD
MIDLLVFDLTGRLVRTLAKGETVAAGPQVRIWDGRDDRGAAVPSGTYFCRLVAGKNCKTLKMTMLK